MERERGEKHKNKVVEGTSQQAIWQGVGEEFPPLEKEIATDVLVVGGGISGLLCAYQLAALGREVTLLEAERLGRGTTLKTTATVTSQQGLIYADMAKKYGFKVAKSYYLAQEAGRAGLEELILKHHINCQFKYLDGYFYTETNVAPLRAECDILQKFGAEVEFLAKIPLPLPVLGAIKQPHEAQFDVGLFLQGLPKNFAIFEHSRVVDVDLNLKIATTGAGAVRYNSIVFATRYPILNKKKLMFAKLYPSMSYAIACEGGGSIDAIYNDDSEAGYTVRAAQGLVVVGGADHRTGRKHAENHFLQLEMCAKKLFPSAKKVAQWAGEDTATFDKIPLVFPLDKKQKAYLVAGFNKWGMANAMVASKVVRDAICGRANQYSALFSPTRGYVRHNIFGMALGAAVVAANLAKSYLALPKGCFAALKPGHGGIFIVHGKKRALYKDRDGALHNISAHCPHLGCELSFNAELTTWDCPCHGSRFDVDGNILDCPAVEQPKK